MTAWPFDDLLGDVARIRGSEWVDIAERLAFEELLSRYDGASATELRDAIAALLARSEGEAKRIAAAFDARYRDSAQATANGSETQAASAMPDSGPSPESRVQLPSAPAKSWPALAAVVFGFVVAAGLVAGFVVKGDAAGPGPVPAASSASAPPDEPMPPPTTRISERDFWSPSATVVGIAAGVAALIALYFGLRVGRRNARAWRAARWKEFVRLDGPRDYAIATTGAAPPKLHAVETMTAALEAAAGKLAQSARVDIGETVRRTANRAAVSIVYESSNAAGRLLVLRDIGQPMLQWRQKVDRTIEQFRREAPVELLYFHHDPTLVSPQQGRLGLPLHEWVAHCGGLPLVLLTDGRFLENPNINPSFIRTAFEPWPLRVVFHPIEDQTLWPAALRGRDAALPAFPMSPAGYQAALRWLPSRARDARARFQPAPSLVWPGDVMRLRGMLAFFPKPTFELAELLRAELMPNVPDGVLLALDPVLFPVPGDDDVEQARTWLKSWFEQNPRDAAAYEEFWRRHVPEPQPGSAAHQRWLRDRATRLLYLSSGAASEAELVALSRALAASPIADEWQREVSHFRRANSAQPELKRLARELAKASERAASETSVGRRPRRLAAPTLGMAIGAIALGLVVVPPGVALTPPVPVLAPPMPSPSIPATASAPSCPPESVSCGDGCVRLDVDPKNCGLCGFACGPDQACQGGRCGCAAPLMFCDGACVDVTTSAAHCGGCKNRCDAPGACANGRCERCSGASGLTDCGGDCLNLQTNALNCGRCGNRCTFSHARSACRAGACALGACSDGYANCDGDTKNGCEVSLGTNVNHCGGCGKRCSTGVCVSGNCTEPPCRTGTADCDGIQKNGCEAALSSTSSCGACGVICERGQVCSAGGLRGYTCVSAPVESCDARCERINQTCMISCANENEKGSYWAEPASRSLFAKEGEDNSIVFAALLEGDPAPAEAPAEAPTAPPKAAAAKPATAEEPRAPAAPALTPSPFTQSASCTDRCASEVRLCKSQCAPSAAKK